MSTAKDVYVYRVMPGELVEVYTGTSSAGAFPATADLDLWGVYGWALDHTNGVITLPSNPGTGKFGQRRWGISLMAKSANTAGAADLLVKKLLIQGRRVSNS